MRAENFFPRRMGLSFTQLSDLWNKYAPTVSANLKTIQEQVGPLVQSAKTTTQPPKPVTSPTNFVPAPAYQKSSTPTFLAILIGLGLVGGGGYYLWKSGLLRKKTQ